MAQSEVAGVAAGDAERFTEAHRQLLADSSIQFEMKPYTIPETPGWVKWLADFLETIFPLLKVLFWSGLAVAAGLVLYSAVLHFQGREFPWRPRRKVEGGEVEWRPEPAPARALLREADALASEGRYAEAVHLLLYRSIEDIDRQRPQLVRPALTSRDIAGSPAIPSAPKRAFQRIVMMVERSLFGASALGEADWRECRSAYEDFAFATGWRE